MDATQTPIMAPQNRAIPLPQTGALAAPADAQQDAGADALAAPVGLAPQIAQNTIAAGQINHGDARDWAENAVAGVNAALAGFGAAGKVPEGAGALYGVGAAARQAQERNDKLRQQKLENQRQQQAQMTEQQLAQAQIAHLNAEQYNIERMGRNADRETMQKLVDSDIAASEPYTEAGIPSLGEHLTSDQLAQLLKPGPNGKSEVNGHEVIPLKDGMTDVIGPDGRPALDKDGNAIQRPTYRLFASDGQVKLDDSQAKFIADNTPYHPAAGVPMSVVDLHTLQTLAKKNQAVDLNIHKVQAEIGKDEAEASKAEGETKNQAEDKELKQQAAKVFTPYLAMANGDPWKAIQLMSNDPNGKSSLGIVEQAYGPGNIETWHKDQEEAAAKQKELDLKQQATGNYTGDPNAATPQQFLESLGPNEQAVIKQIGEGRAPLNSPTYLLARKPEIMEAVAKAYPGFDDAKVKTYQDTYKDFTVGDTSKQLVSGGTALQHLDELRALNTNASRIPGTAAHQAYENKVDTVSTELARFYGTDTVPGIKGIKDTLNATFNRDAAINTQVQSMGDRLDNLETKWTNAAPSKAYQAPMPGISDASKMARANLDPSYAQRIGLTHRVLNKADGKYHWTDSTGQKDLGVAQ